MLSPVVSVIFFDNQKQHEKVILIDASKLGEEYQEGNNKKVRLTNTEIDLIIKTFLHQESVDNFSVAVDYESIKAKKYVLAAGQYFSLNIEFENLSPEEFDRRLSHYRHNLAELFARGQELEKKILSQIGGLSHE